MLLGDEECVLSPKSPVILTYVILPCTTERQNGTKVSPKRASLHSRATISAKSVALECRLGVARGRVLERSKEHKWMVLLLSKTKTHTTVALYGENAAVVIGQGSGGAFQGILFRCLRLITYYFLYICESGWLREARMPIGGGLD